MVEIACLDGSADGCPGTLDAIPARSLKEVTRATRELRQKAKTRGWERTRNGWVCPSCLKAWQAEARRKLRSLKKLGALR